jgi:phthiodiolone/phenolphthiodiolone dimycocerosates ketoreductase
VRVGLQAPGLAVPGLLTATKDQAVAARLDSLWMPDHVIGIFPRSLWTKKYTALARVVKQPDAFVDPYGVLGYLVGATRLSRLGLGVSVTDVARRHPVAVAQTFATLHVLSRGRVRLGLGTGAYENTVPFGIEDTRAVSRLEEGLAVIRALWDSGGRVLSREGELFPLRDALFEIPPYRGTRPPIFVAAHGPRMLKIAGRYGDAWMPAFLRPPDSYAQSLDSVRSAASDAGRDPERIVGSGVFFVLTAPSQSAVEELLGSPLTRTWALHLPATEWAEAGATHPLGADFYSEFLPHLLDESSALVLAEQVPDKLLARSTLAGTPEDVADAFAEYGRAGLNHPVLLNFATPKRAKLALQANVAFARLLRRVKRL